MVGFVFGAIVGGFAAYYWRDRIRDMMSNRVPALREQAAERLGTVGARASDALDRAKSRIDSTVRTGQERIRSAGTGTTGTTTGGMSGGTGVGTVGERTTGGATGTTGTTGGGTYPTGGAGGMTGEGYRPPGERR
ncbi:MAG TPA: YtxH domain-containing protein [Candidatus Tectomicrobia bacterium]|nr:YtxH domain-containing protein [Candidatus Tectomicrobia bacterium]